MNEKPKNDNSSPIQNIFSGVGNVLNKIVDLAFTALKTGAKSGVVIASIVIAALVIAFSQQLGLFITSLLSLFQPPPNTAQVYSSQTIVTGIRPLAQLVTYRVQLAQVNIRVNVQSGIGNMCGYGASHAAEATIAAGIDLSQVTESDVTCEGDTCVVRLPAPQITSCQVSIEEQYNFSVTACNADWNAAEDLAEYEAINEFREDARESGLLETAQIFSKNTLEALFSLNTEQNIVLQFDPIDPDAPFPSECQPEPPAGWTYDATTDIWTQQP